MRHMVSILLVFSVLGTPLPALGQEVDSSAPGGTFHLSVPLLEGTPAPFSGVLMSEPDFRLAIEHDAAAERYRGEVAVLSAVIEARKVIYEAFIAEQRARIDDLLATSWWDDNGAVFMFGAGLVVGIVLSAVLVGLAMN